MMRVAIINSATKVVENMIIADVSDPCPEGYFLWNCPDWVRIGMYWPFEKPPPGWINPNPMAGQT